MDCPLCQTKKVLNHGYIGGRGTLGPLLYVEGNTIAFIECFEASCIDAGMMDKYIRTIFLLDKSVAFFNRS